MDDSYGKASVASTALSALSAVTEKRLVKKNTIGLCRNGKAQLANLSNKRRRLHRRITGLLLICGVIMTIGGLAVDMLFEGGLFGEQQKANALYFQIAWTTGTFSLLLSIMPTYSTSIRLASMYWLAYDLFCLWNNVDQLLLRLDKPPSMGRTRDIVFWSTSLTINISMLWVLRNLAFSCQRRRFTTPPRKALKELWRMSRLFVLALAFASYVAFFYNVFGLDQPLFERCEVLVTNITNATDLPRSCMIDDLATQLPPVSLLVLASYQVMLAVMTSPERRGRILFLLGRVMLGDDAQSAATIASMLPNGKSPEKTIEIAKKRFRALPFSALSVDDFRSNEDTGLYKKTEPATLGAVSAFMSHSWNDNANLKFAELGLWASQHMRRYAEKPTIWLDKGCILQSSATDIKENLLCLPIYLAFCQELLVLAGPSYSGRLWCVLELYCFVVVRPQLDGLVLRPFADDWATEPALASKALMTRFDKFDANQAKCFLDEDRHHLLAMIEAGYGSISAFNRKLRDVVKKINSNHQQEAPMYLGAILERYVV